MDKNSSNKSSNFFKREGFYVILFVCLCIIATVAAITTRNAKRAKAPLVGENTIEQKKKVAQGTEEPRLDYDNALQVKQQESKPAETASNEEPKTAAVSAKPDTTFVKPVEGSLARAYSEDPVYWDSTATYRPNWGIDIKSDLGKPVVAALAGKVENIITDSNDGVTVVINHQNGLKTMYSNLDAQVQVKKDQTVKKGDLIGKVGKTSLNAAYEKYGDHLHFAVLKGTDYIDPAKYVQYVQPKN